MENSHKIWTLLCRTKYTGKDEQVNRQANRQADELADNNMHSDNSIAESNE